MKITPQVRNNICLNAHPVGCKRDVQMQAAQARLLASNIGQKTGIMPYAQEKRPKHVLVIGCSTGYGLASRIVAAFTYHAATVGFSFERMPSSTKTGSPGWYANEAFDQEAAADGLFSVTYNMDAFSNEAKAQAIDTARKNGFAYDLVIYSLASPVRTDPKTGQMYRSVIKPIGAPYTGTTVDVFTGKLKQAEIQPATPDEIAETVKVMGGEDWQLWVDALASANVLDNEAMTVAYSYIGPPLSWQIYRDGTIGHAKADLEAKAHQIDANYKDRGLRAFVSINKAVVTRSSAVIPIIPLYVSTLFKVMKEKNLHEGTLDQMIRLFTQRLYVPNKDKVPVDEEGRIRLDDWELQDSVQQEVNARLARINEENLRQLADIDGFRKDFLQAHGFEIPGVDYDAEFDPLE